MASQHLLHALERFDIDQRRMQPVGVLGSVEGHDADVVVVLENPMYGASS
jgi:hypothetical protein